jgi:hypothetical protein
MHFLSLYPNVFSLLSEAATTPIRSHATASLDSFLNAWFLSPDVGQHLVAIRQKIEEGVAAHSGGAFQRMFAVARANGQHLAACEIGILMYGRSWSYAAADLRCQNFVLPYLGEYDRDRMLLLLGAIEQNAQTYDRHRASSEHRQIKARADQLLDPNWMASFPHFAESI